MTKPAAPHAEPADAWAAYRVGPQPERLRLLRELRDGQIGLQLNLPDGSALPTMLRAVEPDAQRLSFAADADPVRLGALVERNEALAVAYLDKVKLQFDLQGFVLVHAGETTTLHSRLPAEIYRFQRRSAYRVRSDGGADPLARFRHPGMPEMQLALRVLDISIGGCALWLPDDVPPLQPGTRLGELQVQLDGATRFVAPARLLHVTSLGSAEPGRGGVRIGCEWLGLSPEAARALQRWIDRAQQRRHLLARR